MQSKPWQAVMLIFFCSAFFHSSHAQQTATDSNNDYPSEQLLEFLADFGEVDEQTYELIEYHALQRDRQTPEQPAQEQQDDE